MRHLIVALALLTTSACTMTPRYYAGRNLGQNQTVKKDKPGTARRVVAAVLAGIGQGLQHSAAQADTTPTQCTTDADCGYGHNCIFGYGQGQMGHCI